MSTPQKFLMEVPPSLEYRIELGTPADKEMVLQKLKEMKRQTMNFRLMPEADVLLLKDIKNNDKIVGWQGFDFKANPKYVEKFSLHLDADYRAFLLGLALEHALALYLHSMDVARAYVRMESATNTSLLDWRVKTGIYKLVDNKELDPEWIKQCGHCELFNGKCSTQAYFTFDVQQWIRFGNMRLGETGFGGFPKDVVLRKEIMRADEKRDKFSARWAS